MRLGLSLLAIMILSAAAGADTQTHGGAKVSITVPEGYTSKIEAGDILVMQSKDGTVGLLLWVVEKADAAEAIKLLDKGLEGKVSDAKWGKLTKTNINALKGIKNVGTATVMGKPAFTMVAILGPTPTKKGLIVFGAVEQSKLKEHKAELAGIFASLKPTK